MMRLRLLMVLLLALTALGLRATPTPAVAATLCPSSEQDIVNAISNVGAGGTVHLSCPSATTIYFDTANGHNGTGGPITLSQSVTLDASNSPGIIAFDGGHTAQGGGVRLFNASYCGVALELNHLTLQNGHASDGGVTNNLCGSVTITNSTLSGNSAIDGGGIINNGTLTITNSTLSGNSASNVGGAIDNESGTASISNSTLSGNSAGVYGGAIFNRHVSNASTFLSITGSTLSGNSAYDGGAIYNEGLLSIGGSIIASSPNGGNCTAVEFFYDLGYNLTDSGGNCGLTHSTDLTSTDPQLGPLQNNGGPTQTMALQPGSPAIDRIPLNDPNDLCTSNGTDQRGSGFPRPDTGESSCDIGGYEHQGPALCPSSEQDIINAIASDGSGDTITLSCPSATTIYFDTANGHTGTGGSITISQSVTLDASSSPGPITFDGGQSVQLFTVNSGATLALNHLTMQNAAGSNSGGAIFNQGTVNITSSTLSGNSATAGGAIFNSGTVNITGSTLSHNSSSDIGGALYANNGGTVTITDSTLSGNSASADGGAIFDYNATVTVTGSTLAGNAAYAGGATFNEVGATSIGGSIIAGSTSGGNCYVSSPNAITTDRGYNLTDSNGNCGLTSSTDLTNTNPQFGPLQANDGPTLTMALQRGSPAIDQIPTSNTSLCPTAGTDQRGNTRPDDNESACDIGAYESDYTSQSTTLSLVSGSGTYGGSATLTATLTSNSTPVSGETVSFTLNGTAVCGGSTGIACPITDSSGVATLSNVSLTGINAGTLSGAVSASFAGDSSYNSSTGTGDLTIVKADQTITFGTLSNHTYGDAPFTVSASATSGLPVSFSVGSSDQCTISGNTVTITAAGSCTVTALQGGNGDYNSATSVSQTFTIAKTSATITLDAGSLKATYDANPHLATATTTPSGLSYSVTYTDSTNAQVTNPTNAGRYGVTAAITDPNYQGSATGTLVISKAIQTVTVSTPAPGSATYNSAFTVAASASSGLGISYGSSGSCSNTGASYTMTGGTGTCTVTIDQAGNGNYTAAQEVTETVSAQKAGQTITFGSLANHTYGDNPFQLTATDSSGLAVNFSGSGNCTVSGTTVTITGAGSCTVTSSQPGDANYNAAQNVSQTFSIAKAGTTTTLTSSVNPSIVKQGVTVTVKVTSGAGTPGGTVTINDGATALASGVQLDSTGTASITTTALAAGTHNITALYGGNPNFAGSATTAPLSQQVRYTVKVLSTSALTVVLQLQDHTVANVSSSSLTVTAECVVPYSATPPTTCPSTSVQSINKAFGFSTNYKGQGSAYSYSVNPHGLTTGQQYDLLLQTDGDPIWHAVAFTA